MEEGEDIESTHDWISIHLVTSPKCLLMRVVYIQDKTNYSSMTPAASHKHQLTAMFRIFDVVFLSPNIKHQRSDPRTYPEETTMSANRFRRSSRSLLDRKILHCSIPRTIT